jgi:hypothetical protein
MPHQLSDTIALLERTPATLNALLRDLPDTWTIRDEGENTWTPFKVVVHLANNEITNWLPRVKVILQDDGELRKFDSLDRQAMQLELRAKPLPHVLDTFATLRSENLRELRALNLRPRDLERRGRHPVFGAVTLTQLLATWATHDLTHLHQISRVMAHQYRETVGPWIQYLGVLHCNGHSSD